MGALTDKMKNFKGSWLLIAGLAAGAALLILGNGGFASSEDKTPQKTEAETDMTEDYITQLERRVGELLNFMDGVANSHVIITPDAGKETVYAQNGSFSGGGMTEREYVITDFDGNGTPIKVKVIYPKLRGIAVVCKGGSNPIIQEKIISMLCALFDLSSTRVYVSG